jgi:4-diphosphocytidyl-2-C-methyl-D-erythritol kinase
MRGYLILLVYPNLHIPKKEAYTNIQPYEINFDISNLVERKDFFEWKNLLHNDFENSLFPKYPVLNELKESFYEMGAVYAAMSGSGSTIFGIFEKNKLDVLQELRVGYPKEYKTWLGEM